MVIDTSVIIAILNDEPEAPVFASKIMSAPQAFMSAGSYLEAGIVLDQRRRDAAMSALDDLIERLGIRIEPVSAEQARAARAAYRVYGRGNHPAALNFGDCFAYALARALDAPLLFKGGDFARSDVAIV
ncbi:MAG: type II toxin-antitoxin system VapC family toxin [Rhodospirillaceae bacterium]|nr:type II toxin-antitoxin system VapC family toxin [Rhodospirillaceae bacterium]